MLFMIRLENIKRTDEYISADYEFDYDSKAGTIRVKLSDGSAELNGDTGYGWSHARDALLDLAKKEKIPSSYTVMWY